MNDEFESLEIRRATNGFIVTVVTESDSKEYIFDSSRKFVKFIREYVDAKISIN